MLGLEAKSNPPYTRLHITIRQLKHGVGQYNSHSSSVSEENIVKFFKFLPYLKAVFTGFSGFFGSCSSKTIEYRPYNMLHQKIRLDELYHLSVTELKYRKILWEHLSKQKSFRNGRNFVRYGRLERGNFPSHKTRKLSNIVHITCYIKRFVSTSSII